MVGGIADPFARHLPLDDEIGTLETTARVVEQVPQQCGRGAEREGPDGAEGPARQAVPPRVAADDRDLVRTPSDGLTPQVLGPDGVPFQRDDAHAAPGQREGEGATARTDLDDEVPVLEGRLGDHCSRDVRPEEVLSETAPSPVP